MYPRLFELGPITVYTYGVLLAAAYLLGLKLAMVRAQGARPRRRPRARPRHLHHHQRARSARSCCCSITDFRTFTRRPARAADAGALGRRVLRRPDSRGRSSRSGTSAASGLPLWTTCDVFAPGIALGHVVGRFGCLFAGCCYGKPTTLPWGITFTDPFAAANVGTPLGVPLHPDAAVRGGRRAADPRSLLLRPSGRAGRSPGRTFWLYMLLYADLALHHRVLPRRRARHGRHVLDLAVHLDRPRAAGDRACSSISRARKRRAGGRKRAAEQSEPRDA